MRYYVFVKSRFKHTRAECESKKVYVFCYFALFYCILDLRSGECDIVSLYVFVAL